MRKKIIHKILLIFVLTLFSASIFSLSSCSSSKDYKTKYFLLEYVPTPAQKLNSYPAEVQLSDFVIAEAFKRNQIVYRKSAHELNFYNYNQWAVKPEYLISDMAFKHFASANLFETISKSVKQDKPDFVLMGEISALEEYDNKDQWYAHLALTLRLYDMNNEKDVWSKHYDYRKKVAQKDVIYVVRELSYILENIMDDAVKEVDNVLSKLYPGTDASNEYLDSKSKTFNMPQKIKETMIENKVDTNVLETDTSSKAKLDSISTNISTPVPKNMVNPNPLNSFSDREKKSINSNNQRSASIDSLLNKDIKEGSLRDSINSSTRTVIEPLRKTTDSVIKEEILPPPIDDLLTPVDNLGVPKDI